MKIRMLGLAALLLVCRAQAQTMTPEEQSEAIRRLTEEVAALKKEQTTAEKLRAALPTLSGYMQLRFTHDRDASEFSFKRVRLSLDGSITPKVDYKIQLEFAHVKILDAYVDYKPFTELKLRAGQFKIPFGIENTDYFPRSLELQDYPLALQQLMGFSEVIGTENHVVKSSGREMGLSLSGDLCGGILSYDLALFNGAGINTSDNNRPKDIVGRLMVRPVEGLTLAAAHYRGTYDKQHFERRRTALGACYDRGPVVVRSEYFVGKTGHEGYALDSDGLYVLGGWRFHDHWMVAARYDTFTPDVDRRSESRQSDYTCGLSWSPVKRLRLQLDYEHQDRPLHHDNVVKMQFTVSY